MASTIRASGDATNAGDDTVHNLLDTVGEVSVGAEARLERAAGQVGSGVGRANESLRRSSDQTLGIVGALSVGMAMGLLLAGANRLLTTAALIPAALVAGVALERADRRRAWRTILEDLTLFRGPGARTSGHACSRVYGGAYRRGPRRRCTC